MTHTSPRFPVLFVGAGPGDPELITVKGQRALAEADLVIYAGSLVPEALLQWTRPGTEHINSAGMDLAAILETIRQAVHNGRRVVRLHTGDPSLYGAIFEQIQNLEDSNITCRVIPGVTAAFGAAAAIGLEYTLPEVTQTLILTRIAGRTPVPEAESLEKLAAHKASMAIYLSMGQVSQVQDILCRHYGDNSFCVLAYKVSHPDQAVFFTRLGSLVETAASHGISRQALIIVGRPVDLHCSGEKTAASKLYDPGFAHGYRSGQK